ncbi:MAG: uracil-DNA glycosylase [Betaproteobacteria bacterium]|nr:uracil-DNA glycosylase [Betaproteobacteria bacterium]
MAHRQQSRQELGPVVVPIEYAPGTPHPVYDPDCRRCSRLAVFRDQVRERHPAYACRPVPSFGPLSAPLLIVGLAPGMHGANATNRPFTGDGAGPLLYGTLGQLGLAEREPAVGVGDPPDSIRPDDGMRMLDCRICNAVKCLPPDNKPQTAEVRECNAYLRTELAAMPRLAVVLALGTVAHGAVLQALGRKLSSARFAHGARHVLDNLVMYDSYHCSRYNQNTGRLTPQMFHEVFARAATEAAGQPGGAA